MRIKQNLLWALFILLLCSPNNLFAEKRFTFKDGKFKIAQFTDIHWDNKTQNCARTIASIQQVLEIEKPDLAMLTGDVVSAQPAVEGWKAVIRIFDEAKMPYAVVMGNHEADVLDKDSIFDILEKSPYFVGERGPKELSGVGNYVLPVYGSGREDPKALLYCIDSNDYPKNNTNIRNYGRYDWIHPDQIQWYREQSASYTKANGGKQVPSLAFFHIPLKEYRLVVDAETRIGDYGDNVVGDADVNSGFFSALLEMGDVMGTFVGHDHLNNYIGLLNNVALGFGLVSGWDAYGDIERGGRIIELYEDQFKFDTWLRTPTKREYTFYYPSGLNSGDEENLAYLPALNVQPKKQGVAYTYYEGRMKRLENLSILKKVKEGVMGEISIKDALAKDHFAYEFKSYLKVPDRGVYRFHVCSDDGAILKIDGKIIIDNRNAHWAAHPKKAKVCLEPGFHKLEVIYFEDSSGQALEVGICSRNINEQLIPADMLYIE